MAKAFDSTVVADVAVVGAGPAGLTAALAAARAGARVVLCEKLDEPGKKLLATGGGRCNFTNTVPPDEFMARFGRNGRFMQPALARLGAARLCGFFEGLGVPVDSPDGRRVFPASESARDVRDALARRCADLGVRMLLGARASALAVEDGRLAGVEAGPGVIAARSAILATGGASRPRLGSTGDGYALAERTGHTIVKPVPALVALVVRESWARGLAGVALPDVRAWIDLPGKPGGGSRGELLFTHRGVSGPAILDLSGNVARLLDVRSEVPLRVDLTPDAASEEWGLRAERWRSERGRGMVRNLLDMHLPAGLARALVRLTCASEDVRASRLTRGEARSLCDTIKALPLTATATEGFAKAMVTRGGVSLKEVDPRALESRLVPGLYFAGEILDLDGPTGGYNLHWAFASGDLAGFSASRDRVQTAQAPR